MDAFPLASDAAPPASGPSLLETMSLAAARSAGLRYVSDAAPGIRRVRRRNGFGYRGSDGDAVRDPAMLQRIKALAIPPAWTDVWIAPQADAHLQATGRDARGRKQYRYHDGWRAVRDETKFAHMLEFGKALPRIRERVARDLERPGLPRDKVLASVVRLMERTLARIGNPEYARDNHSFGLTTLRNRHVRLRGGTIELDFLAKSGLHHHSVVNDRKLADILRRCRDLPGSELFQYLDEDGARHAIHSEDVNAYLREAAGRDVTAKDFRTWAGTNLACVAILTLGDAKATKKRVASVVREVAGQLGNTPAVCRKSYIHPGVIEAWIEGSLTVRIAKKRRKGADGLWGVERALMRFLARRRPVPRTRAAVKAALRASLMRARRPA